MRALVIGAGPASCQMHLPILAALQKQREIELALICDIDRSRAAAARERFGFQQDCGDGLTALGRRDIEVVYIFGSAQLHYEYGLTALRNGKHLFVEKPIAPSYQAALAMANSARSHSLIAVGGHNRRFYKSLTAVRERAGSAGWQFAEAVFHKPEFGKPPLFGARSWLSANGIHALDALVFLMGGLPEQLTANAGPPGSDTPSAFSAVMRWRSGEQGIFSCNNGAGSRREAYVFHGPGETCSISDDGLTIERNNTVERTALAAVGDGISAEHNAFLEAIKTGIEPLHSIAAIAPTLFLCELIESGFSGRVELPKIESKPVRIKTEAPGRSILVTESSGLHLPLARMLPGYRLVSVAEVQESPAERPDIVAAILGRGSEPLSAQVLARMPQLAIMGVAGLSLSRYEPEALAQRGVTLVNASAAYAQSVADFALGLAILGRRRAFVSHENMRRGFWGTALRPTGVKGPLQNIARQLRPTCKALGLEPLLLRGWRAALPTGRQLAVMGEPRDLQGAIIGLIGWGANAAAFAKRLHSVGARVRAYSQHADPADMARAGASTATLAEVLSADIVSLHRGLNKATRHCLGAAELARLRPGAVLINIARGALIDPDALTARLRQGDVFACLDTFEGEPLKANNPFRSLPNVFLTSHIAGGSRDMHDAAAEEVVRKVAAYLLGEATESVSIDRLRTMS
jgi:phosphoglycerate dehydrogenase-like enzyme/predicted dehydrogenase